MNKSHDKTIRSLLKELSVTFIELLTGENLSKDTLRPLDVKLLKVIEREADLIAENTETEGFCKNTEITFMKVLEDLQVRVFLLVRYYPP